MVPSFLGNRAEGEHLAGKYNDWRVGASPLRALLSRNSSKLQDANRIESRKHHSQRLREPNLAIMHFCLSFFHLPVGTIKHASKKFLGETTS